MEYKLYYIDCMPYALVYLEEFASWLDAQENSLQLRALAHLELLKERGPLLGRPYVDTLKGSQITNLKELRLQHKTEPIRILFAFDPKQQAVIILGGSKQADKRWYDVNMPLAEKRFREYLEKQRKADENAARKEQEK
ncbi:MAG TPA: type II toxin-antitoxin system RelE/ParE family toxin [Trichormus sp.]